MNIGIIGLGLMGGSLALALKDNFDKLKLYGLDKDQKNLSYVKKNKIIDKIIDNENISKLDIIFIAVPVRSVVKVITDLLPYIDSEKTIVSDMGSTKEYICQEIKENFPELQFVAGHPMTGKELSGPEYASASLFKEKTYVIIRDDSEIEDDSRENGILNESKDTGNYNNLINLLKGIGAKLVFMNARRHDEIVALTSHLPHLLAAASVNLLADSENKYSEMSKIMGQGFRDFTRIAGCNPEMWQDIFVTNKKAIIENLDAFLDGMNKFKIALEEDNEDMIYKLMSSARKRRLSLEE
ncbi:prephenate dehydrogenase [Natronospora cellulosivora (SeqCode)]